MGIEWFVRKTDISLESSLIRCCDNIDNQSVGVVECEFSVEFCCGSWDYVDWTEDAAFNLSERKDVTICGWIDVGVCGSSDRYYAFDDALFWSDEQLFCIDKFGSNSHGRCIVGIRFWYIGDVLVRDR